MGIQSGKIITLIAFLCSTYLEIISLKKADKEADEQGKEKDEEKKRYRNIMICLTIAYGIYLTVDAYVGSTVFSIISWLQNHKVLACIYIGVAAILPPALAWVEQKRGTFEAEKRYVLGNLVFNLLGVIAIGGLFTTVQWMIRDFYLLKGFYVEEIVCMTIPIGVWMVLCYQKTERQIEEKGGLDHDASLKNWNQKANLLHLFNMYSLAIISVVYIVAYTIYCQRYHVNRDMNAWYYIVLSFPLIYFYVLSQHKLRYLNLVAYVVIPAILIASVYWTSWFSMNDKIRSYQWIFITVHSTVYILLVFRKEGVGIFGKHGESDAVSDSYLMVFPMIIIALYTIVWTLPKAIDRLPGNEAYNYVDMLCIDTDTEADTVIQKAMEQNMYDEEDHTYDVEMFMRFLSSELENELVGKGIIEKGGEIPARGDLSTWYLNELHRR